ncbi:polyprenyl synthetase family protein [Streptomyces abikoensis]|uniref:polyprenyl synthetase family protein n=1 Tax=Streptomyces abikoensis TaxID=97398 RepID=UPI00340F7506
MSAGEPAAPAKAPPRTLGLDRIRRTVDAELHAFLAARTDGLDPAITDTISPLAALLTGGKHMRSAFCVWGHTAAGGTGHADGDGDAVWKVCAALEIFHSLVLVHDDVVDRSMSRRGMPTTHVHAARMHTERGWHGDADHYGMSVAICVGDLLAAWSEELISQAPAAPEVRLRLHRAFRTMQHDVLCGQLLDLTVQTRRDFRPEPCTRVAHYKSARYILCPALSAAGLLAGAGPEVMAAYERFGTAVGTGYQIRDDLLGVFGDPARTGKSNTTDLTDGKPSTLIATALANATPRQAQRIQHLYGHPGLAEDGADELRALIRATGAGKEAERRIDAHQRDAHRALEEAPLTNAGRDALLELADYALRRDH